MNFRYYVEFVNCELQPNVKYKTKELLNLGITKSAIKKLASRGWLKQYGNHSYGRRYYVYLKDNEYVNVGN